MCLFFFRVIDTNSAGIVSSFQPDALGDDTDIIAAAIAYSNQCGRCGPGISYTGDKLSSLCVYWYALHLRVRRVTCLTSADRQPTPDCGSESVCLRKISLPEPGSGFDYT